MLIPSYLNDNFKANCVLDKESVLIIEAILEVNGLAILGNEDGFDVGELGLAALASLIGIEHDFNLFGIGDELDKLHKVLSLANDKGVNDKWVMLVDLKKKFKDFDLLFLLSDIGGKIDIAFSLMWNLFWSWIMDSGWLGLNGSWLSVLDSKPNISVLVLLDLYACVAFRRKDTRTFHDV